MTYLDTSRSSYSGRPLWHDPMFWGIVGSLGVHMVFWIVAPFLNTGDRATEEEIQRPVSLVDLTPAERQRLPDFLTDEVTLPEVEPSNSIPQPRNMPLVTTPGRAPVRFSPTLPPFFVPPPPPELPSYRPPNLRQRRIIIQQQQQAAQPDPPAPSQPPRPTSPPATPNPAETTPPESPSGSETLGPVAADTNRPPRQGNTPRPRFNRPENRAELAPQVVAALEQQRSQPELFAFNEEGTTENAYGANGSAWLANIASLPGGSFANLPDPESYPRVEIAAPYPEEACIQALEGTAIVGVAVNADGSVVTEEGTEPSILRSSGYGFLNERAKELAAEFDFEASDTALPYLVTVSFTRDPEVCEPYLNNLQNGQSDTPTSDQG